MSTCPPKCLQILFFFFFYYDDEVERRQLAFTAIDSSKSLLLGNVPEIFILIIKAAKFTTSIIYAAAASKLPKSSTVLSKVHSSPKSFQFALSNRQWVSRHWALPSADVNNIGKWALTCKSDNTFQLQSKTAEAERREKLMAVNAPVCLWKCFITCIYHHQVLFLH